MHRPILGFGLLLFALALPLLDSEAMAADLIEEVMRSRAMEDKDFKALAFLLRGLKPERYGTRRFEQTAKIEHAHRHAPEIDLTVLTDAELQQLTDLTLKIQSTSVARG